jgi:hypothetical protein
MNETRVIKVIRGTNLLLYNLLFLLLIGVVKFLDIKADHHIYIADGVHGDARGQ